MDDGQRRDLDDERAAQKRYAQRVREAARAPVKFEGPQNTQWTGDGRPKFPPAPIGYLLGRIALTRSDEMLGNRNDFYIGERHLDLDGVEVFSWAAPVACTFYRGLEHHEWCDDVAVIRSFAHKPDGEIEQVADDIIIEGLLSTPFAKRALSIPKPRPGGPPRALPLPRPPVPPSAAVARPSFVAQTNSEKASPPPSPPAPTRSTKPVRAEAVLRSRMVAPRGKTLRPVLSTLQPDQYELVTYPARQNLIVEGQPGTGKTIVATHRAAYLLNAEAGANAADGDVLIVGPTFGYSQHVRGVIGDLVDDVDRIHVLSMPELVVLLIGLRQPPRGAVSTHWQDCDWELGSFARAAAARLRKKRKRGITSDEVYDYLRANGEPERPLTHDHGWIEYLRELPSYDKAIGLRAHSALISVIKWTVSPHGALSRISHVIVDEAQDVTPLEWFLLEAINGGAWTLLGDLNQRRSDHTLGSWRQVLDVVDVDENDARIRRLERGYRSTRPILEFANRLLPRIERAVLAFQEHGPTPSLIPVRKAELGVRLDSELRRLLTAYPDGTLAVIAADFAEARRLLRTQGWAMQAGNVESWLLDDRVLRVIGPNAARGLEYDAVVVIEPADFPINLGRRGPLYTSLTRANRELSVIHTKPLPDSLRK